MKNHEMVKNTTSGEIYTTEKSTFLTPKAHPTSDLIVTYCRFSPDFSLNSSETFFVNPAKILSQLDFLILINYLTVLLHMFGSNYQHKKNHMNNNYSSAQYTFNLLYMSIVRPYIWPKSVSSLFKFMKIRGSTDILTLKRDNFFV